MKSIICSAGLCILFLIFGCSQMKRGVEPGLDDRRIYFGSLPCKTRDFASIGEQIFLLDKCGSVFELNARSGETRLVLSLGEPGFEIAAGHDRFAILCGNRDKLIVLDGGGTVLSSFVHDGPSYIVKIALWNDMVVVSPIYDEYLIYLYSLDGDLVATMIPNHRYLEDYAPSIASTLALHGNDEELLVFDLFDYRLFVVDAELSFEEVQKEQHPGLLDYVPPQQRPMGEEKTRQYRIDHWALSITTIMDDLYVLMVSRDGSGAKEIALSPIRSQSWAGSIDLAPIGEAAMGTSICASGSTIFVLERKGNCVYRIETDR